MPGGEILIIFRKSGLRYPMINNCLKLFYTQLFSFSFADWSFQNQELLREAIRGLNRKP